MIYAKSTLGGMFSGNEIPKKVSILTKAQKNELIEQGIDPDAAIPTNVAWTKISKKEYDSIKRK